MTPIVRAPGTAEPGGPPELFGIFEPCRRGAVVAHAQFHLPDEFIADKATHPFDKQAQILPLWRETQVLLQAQRAYHQPELVLPIGHDLSRNGPDAHDAGGPRESQMALVLRVDPDPMAHELVQPDG